MGFCVIPFQVVQYTMSLEFLETMVRNDPLWNSPLKHDDHAVTLLNGIIQDNRIYMTLPEMMNLYRMVLRANMIAGDMAEVGVCKGGSAKLIAEVMDRSKRLFLFDSFAGMPEVTPGLDTVVLGDMASSYEDACNLMRPYSHTTIIKGMFPESAKELPHQDMKFSFVHLDVDTYKSTLEGLNYFYPRLTKGAYLLTHDYNATSCPGVRKAFDEFLFDKPEGLIDLWNTQAAFIKL